MINKMLDIIISLVGLLCLLLMLPWIALLIKIDSRGPVFHRCKRVGKGGKIFEMVKFRTMYETPVNLGPSISPQGDPRVTPLGRILRRTKINEFPQFINILTGDMTLIGPRPEAPDLAAAYPETALEIFSVKPGLSGPNQILGRNEEELYPPGVDPIKYYIEHILPRKLPLDLAYIQDKSVFKNLKYLFLSVKVTLTGTIGRRHLSDNRSQIYLMLTDSTLCLFSFLFAHYLRFESFTDLTARQYLYGLLPLVVLIRLPIFLYFGFYHTLIRYISIYDLKMIAKGVALSSIFLIGLSFFFGVAVHGYSRAVIIIDWFCLTTLLVGYRVLLKKLYVLYKTETSTQEIKRVLIWGAGDAGELCLRYLQKDKQTKYEVMGFIDDAPLKRNRALNGVKILGNRHHLELLAQLYKIQEVFLAMHKMPEVELQRAVEICKNLGLEAKLFQLRAMPLPGRPVRRHPAKVGQRPAEISSSLSIVTNRGN